MSVDGVDVPIAIGGSGGVMDRKGINGDGLSSVPLMSSEPMPSFSSDFTSVTGDPFGVAEVQEVLQELKESFCELSYSLKEPNIMLIGKTGSGKSSLVNAVFRMDYAETGTGRPVTKHIQKYTEARDESVTVDPDDPLYRSSVCIYDTKGLEHGFHEEFLDETEAFLSNLKRDKDVTQYIHVIWFIIDMSHCRVQDFELKLCKTVLSRIPLIFVLNKCDTATPEQLKSIRELLEEQHLENCKGIYEVVADRKNYSPDVCPHCHSDQIRFKQRTKEIICDNDNCKKVTVLGSTSGLDALVQETIKQLPHFARHSFVEAQKVSEREKLVVAKEVIMFAASAASKLWNPNPTKLIVDMATKLALLWGFKFFPSIVTQEIAHQYFKGDNILFGRVAMLLTDIFSKRRLSQALTIATGVEICRLFIELRMKSIGLAIKPNDQIPEYLESCFSLDISDEMLEQITNNLRTSENHNTQHALGIVQLTEEVDGVALDEDLRNLEKVVAYHLSKRVDAILFGTPASAPH